MVLYTDGHGHYFQYAEGVKAPKHLTKVEPAKGKGEGKDADPDTKQVRKVSKK